MANPLQPRRANRWALYFSWLGGAVAWGLHFAVVYVAAEFGCVAGLGQRVHWGLSVIAWIVVGVTLLALLVTSAAAWTAYRLDRLLRVDEQGGTDTQAPRPHLARTGLITSLVFAYLTVVQAIPIFFFPRDC